MSNWAIIVAAGKSIRFGDALPKQFHEVAGRPLLAWTIAAFEKANLIDQIVVVISQEFQLFVTTSVIDKSKFRKVSKIVNGGASRRESVFNALKEVPVSAKIVAIHDGVRPLVQPIDIDRVVETASKNQAAMLAVPAKDTVKQVEGDVIVKTLERDEIWLAQTPQAFEYNLILKAHQEIAENRNADSITDDSLLVEKIGIGVKVIEPRSSNIKVTTLEDLAYVESVLRMRIDD
jgi:2-C-methyl-D-erythritol 4-phosphate cytidylyltransferase